MKHALASVCMALMAGAFIFGCGDDDTAPSGGTPDYPNDNVFRINQIQCRGTHNSYHVAHEPCTIPFWMYTDKPLDQQLEMGIRQFELDIHYNWGRGLKVYHVPVIDDLTTCEYFVDCLSLIKDWSDVHRGHHILFVLVEPKDDIDLDKLTEHWREVEEEILSVWPIERIYTPDDLTADGDYATLQEALMARGWPTLGEARGRVIFLVLDSGPFRDAYVKDNPTLKDRIMFAKGGFDDPFGGFTNLDDPVEDWEEIQEAIKAGYLIRTRADAECIEAFTNDRSRQEKALASGAQIISTDFPEPPEYSAYFFDIPGGTPSRCNPLTAPDSCTAWDVEHLAQGS